MFNYINGSDLFIDNGKHFVSEIFIRMFTYKMRKHNKPEGKYNNPSELLIIFFSGNGEFVTPNSRFNFNASDQVYLTNTDLNIYAHAETEIEFVHLPGPYTAKRYTQLKPYYQCFTGIEFSTGGCIPIANGIYGNVKIMRFRNEIFKGNLIKEQALLILCLQGTCDLLIKNERFALNPRDQVYLESESFEVQADEDVTVEFIFAPGKMYANLKTLDDGTVILSE
ncbi:MAG: hypothetical protein LBS34_02495 [Rickettsiales bacterium]|jgi:hypothetical protein|nr:hypothetical protein [Rickettsiales bacterium]